MKYTVLKKDLLFVSYSKQKIKNIWAENLALKNNNTAKRNRESYDIVSPFLFLPKKEKGR